MTGRERLHTAIAGGSVRPSPVLCWAPDPRADGVVSVARPDEGQAWWPPVKNPFGRAQDQGLDVRAWLESDPGKAEAALETLKSQTQVEIERARQDGADGVVYLLFGATAAESTPMEYGGHWLEIDRSLLRDASLPVLVYVLGDEEPYIDFVSDLPCQAFGFDPKAFPLGEARALRQGPLALPEPSAEIYLVDKYETAEPWLDRQEVPA
ncbi:MAG: hypothetical protein KF884_09320 [Fimbriimonadaceae bacterium]|nr:hypothetical protein [Fimbriimonadaceae bacterium]QYK57745.1 MAG: hypothetical protein KF884_09320 [Fimbriimonadaceae bacterium]